MTKRAKPRPCHKLAFKTVEQADRTAEIISRQRGGARPPSRIYTCPDCGLLHFSSKSEEEVGSLASTVATVRLPPPPSPSKPATARTRPQQAPEFDDDRARLRHALTEAVSKLLAAERKMAAIHEHAKVIEVASASYRRDVGWFKERMREAASLVRQGLVDDANYLLETCGGLKTDAHPARHEDWRALLAPMIAERRAFFGSLPPRKGAAGS